MQGQRSSVEPFPDPFGFEPGSDNPDPFSSIWTEPGSESPDPFSTIWTEEPESENPDPFSSQVNAVNSLSLQTPTSLTQSTQSHTGFGLEEETETRPGSNMERTTRLACKRKNIEIGSTSNSNNNNNNGASSSSSSGYNNDNSIYQNPNANPNPNLVGANLLPVPVNYMGVPGLNDPSDDPFPGFVTQLSQNGNGTGAVTGTSSQRSFRIRTGPTGGAIMGNYANDNLRYSVPHRPNFWPSSNNNTDDFMNNGNNDNNNDYNNRRRFSLWGPPNNNNNNNDGMNTNEPANHNVTDQHVFPPPPPILEPSVPGLVPVPTVHRFPRNPRIGTSASSPIDLESAFMSDFISPMGNRRGRDGNNNNNNNNNWDEERERLVRAGPASSASVMGGPTWNPASRYHHHRNFTEEMGAAGRPGMRGHHHHHNQGPPRLRPAFLLDRSGSGGNGDVWGVPLALRSREGRRIIDIRNALELMRRGDNLRFENIYYGGVELHDRHRDMRLDIDNMSYEELLALEERIGNVNTGLNEESIKKLLKQFKYTSINLDTSLYEEPCSICQEEYNEGEDLGRLDCGHDFHAACIKQWLLQKNMCPICKSTGLIP